MQLLHDQTFGRIARLMHEAIGLSFAEQEVAGLVAPGARIQKLGWTASRTTCA
jgi:hypothetical protein